MGWLLLAIALGAVAAYDTAKVVVDNVREDAKEGSDTAAAIDAARQAAEAAAKLGKRR